MKTKIYANIEEAYTDLFDRLNSYAKRHLRNDDFAIDCVHTAFEKALSYAKKNPSAVISDFILYRETIRECRRINKQNGNELQDDTSLLYL